LKWVKKKKGGKILRVEIEIASLIFFFPSSPCISGSFNGSDEYEISWIVIAESEGGDSRAFSTSGFNLRDELDWNLILPKIWPVEFFLSFFYLQFIYNLFFICLIEEMKNWKVENKIKQLQVVIM